MKKVALITGGSRGIGLGIATRLADAGFDLAINGVRDEASVTAALDGLRTKGSRVIYCRGDVASSGERKSVVEQVRDSFGKLHVLVNNAGIAPRERLDILEAKEEIFDEVINTNLKGPYFLTQLVANWMIGQKKNSGGDYAIVNVSSVSAAVASVNRGEYCISKAGVAMATQLFAARLGEFGIPVFEVRPGIVMTDMTSGVKEKYDRLIENGLTVQKRWGTPEDVGGVVQALVSGNFPYSTGQVVMVDGGMTIRRL